jgi:hypothetical protein
LLFTHTLYRDDMLERVISATSTVFFCALELKPEKAAESSGSARNMDPGSLQESDLDIGEEYEDDESKSTEERTLLRAKRGLRKALKERRLLAVSSIDGIIDFWKQILTVSGLTPSTSERSLQSFVDEDHDFDPYAFKRRTITILMRYLPSMWAHEAVSSLPPSTVRNLLDLMQVALKSLQDSKFFPLQSAVSERDRQRTTTEALVASASAPAAISAAALAPSRANARLLRRGATADSASSAFRVYESAVTILTDMGFLEADVRRLATVHRTNSISTLTTHLLEMGSTPAGAGAGVESTRDAAAAFLAAASAAVAAMIPAESSSSSSSSSDIPKNESEPSLAEDGSDEMDVTPSQEYTHLEPEDLSESSPAVNGDAAELVITVAKPLPLIPRKPSEKLQKGKAVLQQILQKVLSMVPLSCLRLVERGVVKPGGEWGIEVSSVNQVCMDVLYQVFYHPLLCRPALHLHPAVKHLNHSLS